MPSLSERLSTLHAERGHLVANYEGILQASLDEGRDLSDVEVTALAPLKERIEGVDRQLDTLTQAEALLARQATAVPMAVPGNRPGSTYTLATPRQRQHIEMQRRDDYKGASFTRWAIACCVAGAWNAAEYARQRWRDDELADTIQYATWFMRNATTPGSAGPGSIDPSPPTAGDFGGFLVRLEHMGAEFIELLRPMLIVSRLPSMRRLQFNAAGTLLIPRQSGGVTGGYIGEGNNIPVQRLAFGQLQLTPSKLAVIVPMTNEILHRADPGLEQLVRDDMLEGTARTIDTVFFSTGAAAAAGTGNPAGILFGRPENTGGQFDDVSDPVAGPPSTVTVVTNALKNMILALRMENVPFLAPVWVMNARTKEFLRLLRSSIDVFVFKAEIDAGTLLGYPIIDSTNVVIPFPPGTGQETAYALIDAAQVIWAEDMMPLIDASEHASIYSADYNTVPGPALPPTITTPLAGIPAGIPYFSAFQNDMTLMRIRMRHTWGRRHDVAVTWARVGPGLP